MAKTAKKKAVRAKTKTVPYDVAEHLRTPEEMAAYLDAIRSNCCFCIEYHYH